MPKPRLNGAAKWVAIGVGIAVAVLGSVYGYGQLAEQVTRNKGDITALQPLVREVRESQIRIETEIKGIKKIIEKR